MICVKVRKSYFWHAHLTNYCAPIPTRTALCRNRKYSTIGGDHAEAFCCLPEHNDFSAEMNNACVEAPLVIEIKLIKVTSYHPYALFLHHSNINPTVLGPH